MEYQEGQLVDGRYSLERFIGSGSFGEVWVAKDTQTDMEIAIKIYISMDKHGLEEFKKEFQVSFDLNQTNLLHSNYLGVDATDSRAYLIMPFCPEGSVTSRIGQMTENELWKFIYDVASGLAYLHSHNIIHQDIKPDNILISRTGDYLITDFGISRQVRATLRRSARNASVSGAPAYMGPERYSSNPLPIKASDIWSLGATIYELAAGDLPFCGMGGVMQKNGADMTELPEHFSEAFKSVVYRCLALEPWDRPAAKDLVEEARTQIHNIEAFGKTIPLERASDGKEETKEDSVAVDNRKTRKLDVSEFEQNKTVPVSSKSGDTGMKTVMVGDPAPSAGGGMNATVKADSNIQLPEATVFAHDNQADEKKAFGLVVWILVAVAGLICGVVTNLFV